MKLLMLGWPRMGGTLLAAFLAVSPLMPLDGLRLLLLFLLLAGALIYSRQRADLSGWLTGWLIWGPWATWAGLSIFWSLEPDYSAYYWLNEVLMSVLMFVLGSQLARQGVDEIWLFSGLALMVFVQALLSFAHVQWPLAVPLYYPGWLDNEPQSTAYLVMGVAAAVWWLHKNGRSAVLISLLIFVGIQLVAWIALKRSPFLALMVQSTLLLLLAGLGLGGRIRWKVCATLLIVLLVSAVLAIQVGERRPASYASGNVAGTGLVAAMGHNERYQMWSIWLERGQAHLWQGTGAGRYLPTHVYVGKRFEGMDPWLMAHAHNGLLNQWLQLGLIGAAAYLYFWLALFICSLRGLTAANCQHVRNLSGLALSVLLAMVIRNGTDDVLFGSCGSAWWLVLAYLLRRAAVEREFKVIGSESGLA